MSQVTRSQAIIDSSVWWRLRQNASHRCSQLHLGNFTEGSRRLAFYPTVPSPIRKSLMKAKPQQSMSPHTSTQKHPPSYGENAEYVKYYHRPIIHFQNGSTLILGLYLFRVQTLKVKVWYWILLILISYLQLQGHMCHKKTSIQHFQETNIIMNPQLF